MSVHIAYDKHSIYVLTNTKFATFTVIVETILWWKLFLLTLLLATALYIFQSTKFLKEVFGTCFNANPNSCIDEWSMHVLYCLEQIRLLSADLVGLLAFRPACSLKLMRPLVDSSITVIKVKVFKERPARTFLPRLVHSLFPNLVSLCEIVNSSFVLRANAVEPRVLHFFGQIVPLRFISSRWRWLFELISCTFLDLPKVAVTISSHDIAKSPCLLGSPLKHVYLKLRSEVVSNERESALFQEAGFFSVLIIIIE